jgi:hypothetical protein
LYLIEVFINGKKSLVNMPHGGVLLLNMQEPQSEVQVAGVGCLDEGTEGIVLRLILGCVRGIK